MLTIKSSAGIFNTVNDFLTLSTYIKSSRSAPAAKILIYLLEVFNMFNFIIGLFIGSFLYFNPAYIVPVLCAITLLFIGRIIYAYIKSGELKL